MSRTARILEAERARKGLEDYLSRWDLEIRVGSPPRHLEPIGEVCRLELSNLERATGETTESHAFAQRIECLATRSVELWKRPSRPSLVVVQ